MSSTGSTVHYTLWSPSTVPLVPFSSRIVRLSTTAKGDGFTFDDRFDRLQF